MTEQDILDLISKDKWMMDILRTAEKLNLPDWAIGAGFVRNKVWDYLYGYTNEKVNTHDIDCVYFDPNGNGEEGDRKLSEKLKNETGIEWEVVNEVYAHLWMNRPSYTSTKDAIAHWPETATAVGVRLDNGKLSLIAPYGIDDLVNLIVRPSPKFEGDIEMVKQRMTKKKWLKKWV